MKKERKVFLVLAVSIVIVLLLSTSLVSALNFSDVWKSIKDFFGFGEKEEDLGGELKTGPGGSPDYLRICEEGEKRCELMPSRMTTNFRYSIKQCQNNVWIDVGSCEVNRGCRDGECINQTIFECYNDSDCPPVYGDKYCNNKSESCQSIGQYRCVNNTCVSVGGGIACKNCTYGCADGECVQLSGTCTANESGSRRCYYFDEKHGGPVDWVQECIVRGANSKGAWTNIVECEYGCKEEACLPFNATISLATLKDKYKVGEQINLTDPPEANNNIFESLIKESSEIEESENSIIKDRGITKEKNQNILEDDYRDSNGNIYSSNQIKKSLGYIVQFEDKPLIEKKVELETEAKENEDYIKKHPILSTITTYRFRALTPEKVTGRVRDYAKNLERNNQEVKERVLAKIKERRTKITGKVIYEEKEVKVMNEFTNVFNGVALDVSESEIEEIKKVEGVKAVYPNLEVQVTLMGSVPLINADDVWQLQDDLGRNITGENVTIAIIDTGIDYTHPDLGGDSIIERERDLDKINVESVQPWFSGPEPESTDQQISLDDRRLAYYSGDKIYIYNFDTNETSVINSFSQDMQIIKLFLKDNLLLYFAAGEDSNYLVLYNLDTTEYKVIDTEIDDIGAISISNQKVIYGKRFGIISNIYVYDILTEQTKTIAEDSEYMYLQVVSNELVIYPFSTGHCYDKAVLYNLISREKTEIFPPDIGPVLDFEGNKILYVACSKTDFDPQWKTYYFYDIYTGEYTILREDITIPEEKGMADILMDVGATSWISKGAIGDNVVFFSKDISAKRIMAYDFELSRYVQINLFRGSGAIDAEGNKICFLRVDMNVYCHDYNSSYDYPVAENVFTNKVIGGYDFINDDNDPMDDMGHGTHVAGIAAGESQGDLIENYKYEEGNYFGIGEYFVYGGGDSNNYFGILKLVSMERESESTLLINVQKLGGDSLNTLALNIIGDYAYASSDEYFFKANISFKTLSITWGTGADYDNPGSFTSNFNIDISKSIGLNGVAPDAKLYAYKVLDSRGSGTFANVISAMEMAVDPNNDGNFSDHVDIASMSFGARGYYWCYDDNLSSSIINAINLGIIPIIAAGNDGPNANTITYPACIKEVISVGSSTNYNQPDNYISDFSSRGFGLYNGKPILKPDIVAPGQDICSAQYDGAWNDRKCFDDKHVAISGTSMATPHVAGAVALIKQAHPNLNPEEIKSLLMNNANEDFYYYESTKYSNLDIGTGLMDVLNSINNYKEDKLIVTPGSISFGVFDLSEERWSISENVKIINNANSDINLQISIEGDFPQGVSFEYPTSSFVGANSEFSFEFKVSANKNIEDKNYEGNLVINNGLRSIKIPFFFKKMHLSVILDKKITSSNARIKIHSDVPLSQIISYIINPDSKQSSLELDYVDIQNFKGIYEPSLDGEYIIKIEAKDEQGNTLYGETSFIADLTAPELQLSLENNKVEVTSNEEIGQVWLEEQLTDTTQNVDNVLGASPTIESVGDKTYINYIWEGKSGFDTPFIIYNREYSKVINKFTKENVVVDGTELFNSLKNEINRENIGLTVFMYQDPILIKDSSENVYTIFGYETNNGFCGVKGIGIRKLNKQINSWEILNDNLNRVDVCSNDVTMCQDPASYQEYWCEGTNGRFAKDISNIRAKFDKENNINLFWTESNGGSLIDGKIFHKYLIYYKKIDKDGNTLIEKTSIVDVSNPNQVKDYYVNHDFVIDSKNNVYLTWSEPIKDGIYSGVPDYKTYYKLFNFVTSSWSNNIEIITPYIHIHNLDIDENDLIHLTYDTSHDEDYFTLYYGILNTETNSVDYIKTIKDSWGGNKENSLSVDKNGNVYIIHDESEEYNLTKNYDFYSKDKGWETGKFFDKGNSIIMGKYGLKTDELNNIYSALASDINHLSSFWTVADVFFKRITNPPSLLVTKPDSAQELIKLEDIDGVWKADLDIKDTGQYKIEAYATDSAGNLGYDSIIVGKPQSKLVNNENYNIPGRLTMFLQKNISGSWQDAQVVVDKQVTIPANNLLKLDSEWNPQNVSVSEPGDYRVYAKFEVGGQSIETSWEFSVV